MVVTTISILSCLRFYGRNKPKLQQHKILLKLFTFKSIIGLNVLQTVRFPPRGQNGPCVERTKYESQD